LTQSPAMPPVSAVGKYSCWSSIDGPVHTNGLNSSDTDKENPGMSEVVSTT
jgi:hypothetical protein